MTVSAGGRTQLTSVAPGVHTLWFAAGKDQGIADVRLGSLVGQARLCTADVSVGFLVVPPTS
jgi:hypothetical protein